MCKWGTDFEMMVLVAPWTAYDGMSRWDIRKIDACIAPLIRALNDHGMYTANSCCGHGKGPGSIIFHDGRELILPTLTLEDIE